MTLLPGSRFGAYDVISPIGRGGMGEVYRALDPRLGREVALKVLPDLDASDPERRMRFDREARALASLSHPNIATIFGLEQSRPGDTGTTPTSAIVMELVDGETLADRLRRGPLPLDEALNIAGQIADALDAAHQKGIVHRDLKPANVQITPTGTVKVLDFGLAKLVVDAVPEDVTRAAVTAPASVLGTAAYMAPEQAQGRPVDRRTDIWAFGVVLFEMVTGDRLFRGASLQDTLAAVLTVDPPWERVPATLQPVLRGCLKRDPAERLRDIGDYRFLLGRTPAAVESPPHRTSRVPVLAAGALGLSVLAFVAGNGLAQRNAPAEPSTPLRFATMLPAGVSVTRGPAHTSSVAISPDGQTVVIAASDKDGSRLYSRSRDQLDPTPIPGTERGLSPFFSWDGKWIGFYADGRLKRIPVAGGASVEIAVAPGFSAGASWGPDDRIVFSYGADSHLQVVSAQGGSVEPLTREMPGRHPEVLPDGQTVLFEAAGHIHAYNRASGAVTRLLPGTAPRYSNGHVLFIRGTTLLAAPFDAATGSAGTAVPVAEGVAVELPGSGGGRHYAISRSGALVYVPAADAYELVVAGADGVQRRVGQPQRSLENPRFSPGDGRYVVVASRRRDDEPADLWLHDLRGRTPVRLTSHGGRAAVWAGTGTVTYSHLGGQRGIFSIPVGGGESTEVLPIKTFHWLVGWTPDRSSLLYGLMLESQSAIEAYSNGQSRTVVSPGHIWGGRLSRDGKWLAYYVLNAGTFEVYVTPFPEGRPTWPVVEGTDPSWGPDGSEIYYRSGPRLMAARIDKGAGIKVLESRIVIDPFLPPLYDDYDVHPDGRTIVFVRPANETQGREVRIVIGGLGDAATAAR